LVDRKKKTIFDAIQQVIRIYKGKGHSLDQIEFEEDEQEKPIHTIMADNEFQALKEDLEEIGMNVHVVSKNEHAPEVERQNRVIKERARAVIQTMLYERIPKKMRIALVQYTVFWLNNIPKEGQDQSPKEIIMGEQKLDAKYICKLPFGAYAQVYEDREITNTMLPRTTGAINLGPSNLRGGHKFLSLETGEILMRRRWTEMPVPTDVVARLEEMSSDPNDSLHDYIIDNIDDNMNDDERDNSEDVGNMNEEEEEIIQEEEKSDRESDKMLVDPTFMCQENENHDHDLNDNVDIEDSSNTEYEADEREKENNEEVRDVDKTETIAHRYNLRPNCYSHKYSFLSVHAGVKRWGDRAKDAIKDELNNQGESVH